VPGDAISEQSAVMPKIMPWDGRISDCECDCEFLLLVADGRWRHRSVSSLWTDCMARWLAVLIALVASNRLSSVMPPHISHRHCCLCQCLLLDLLDRHHLGQTSSVDRGTKTRLSQRNRATRSVLPSISLLLVHK